MPVISLPAYRPLHLLPCFSRLVSLPLSGSLALTPPPSFARSLPCFQVCFPPQEVQSLLPTALPASSSPGRRSPVLTGLSAAFLSSSSAPYSPLSVRAFDAVRPPYFIGLVSFIYYALC